MAAQVHQHQDSPTGPAPPLDDRCKPELVNKIEMANSGDINGVVKIPGKDAIITVSSDRSVRVWMLRDSGQYWPSVCHYMGGGATALHFNAESRRVFVGLETGVVAEFHLSDDCNRLDHVKDYHAHTANRVTGVHYSAPKKWLLSCAKDKYFQFHCTGTGRRLGGYLCNAACTTIDYDEDDKYVFIGDYSGKITVCKLVDGEGVQFINVLKGHNGSIQSLHWDGSKGWLYSGSYDASVFVWDIGGRRGTVYELHGHRHKVTCIAHLGGGKPQQQSPQMNRLMSAGEDGNLVLWDMSIQRQETADWIDSNNCQLCNKPFFWNFRAMYDQKQIGLRQHHCRKCGRAVCDGCSPRRLPLTLKGHEIPVRICEECHIKVDASETKSHAKFYDLKHSVNHLSFDQSRQILVTSGSDHIVKIWNVKSLIQL